MYIAIETTIDDINKAKLISKELLNKGLSPCIQIIDKVSSLYIWNDKITKNDEVVIKIKTISSNISKIKKVINKLHNYENPEIIAYEFKIVSEKYKSWFNDNCN